MYSRPPKRVKKSIHGLGQRTLCELLKARRIAKGLTQQQFAKRLKAPQSFVSKVEAGERRLDVVEFFEYVTALGSVPEKLFAEFGNSFRSTSKAEPEGGL
jgi:transcriptional regulator with XRE-family HTH domain